jgi:hypothetical protein
MKKSFLFCTNLDEQSSFVVKIKYSYINIQDKVDKKWSIRNNYLQLAQNSTKNKFFSEVLKEILKRSLKAVTLLVIK